MSKKYDFCGWATRNDLRCSDGRTIRKDAFKDNDGRTVPLVWMHQHDDPGNVLGHALLENRDEGVYMYGSFNSTAKAQHAKELVEHGDVVALSIYANKLQQKSGDVLHGVIREVILVLSGANPGAYIEFPILEHSGEEAEDEALIYTGEGITIAHAEEEAPAKAEEPAKDEPKEEEKKEMADEKDKTVKDVFDELTEEQKKVVYFMIGQALEDAKKDESAKHSDFEGEDMKYNVFEGDANEQGGTLSHADMEVIIKDAKRLGSLKESFLAHAEEYGIENIEYLFPDAKALNNPPDFIKRNDEWVDKFMNATHHTPFSRIKSIHADITEDEARARGYIKGKLKKEEVFALLKRVTTPTTIYKKQKLDRDDVIDITDFDVVSWLKTEMRMMLNEEIARACLVGDGRSAADEDKISELNVRPIYKDTEDELYAFNVPVTVAANATDDDKAKAFIRATLKARKSYKGTGKPTLFTTEDMLSNLLLLTDETGRDLYENEEKLAQKLRVKEIVTVEVMEGISRTEDGSTFDLAGIIVNPTDYNIGADKGGAINMFDDFDIDYNQMKYLIETRISGALTKPKSAMVIEFTEAQ